MLISVSRNICYIITTRPLSVTELTATQDLTLQATNGIIRCSLHMYMFILRRTAVKNKYHKVWIYRKQRQTSINLKLKTCANEGWKDAKFIIFCNVYVWSIGLERWKSAQKSAADVNIKQPEPIQSGHNRSCASTHELNQITRLSIGLRVGAVRDRLVLSVQMCIIVWCCSCIQMYRTECIHVQHNLFRTQMPFLTNINGIQKFVQHSWIVLELCGMHQQTRRRQRGKPAIVDHNAM